MTMTPWLGDEQYQFILLSLFTQLQAKETGMMFKQMMQSSKKKWVMQERLET